VPLVLLLLLELLELLLRLVIFAFPEDEEAGLEEEETVAALCLGVWRRIPPEVKQTLSVKYFPTN
jgi:hypothetical protein